MYEADTFDDILCMITGVFKPTFAAGPHDARINDPKQVLDMDDEIDEIIKEFTSRIFHNVCERAKLIEAGVLEVVPSDIVDVISSLTFESSMASMKRAPTFTRSVVGRHWRRVGAE